MKWGLIALPVFAFAAMSWGATSSAMLPSPTELVPNTVARISHVPDGPGTITRSEFRHSLVLAAAAEGRRRVPNPHEVEYKRLMQRALEELLEAVWLKGQAAEMNIVVTPAQVSRQLAHVKKQLFESAAEYRKFLKQTRFTRRDIYERVELQLLSMRIQRRVVSGVKSYSELEKVLKEFAEQFHKRWRDRTVCAPAYAIDHCSNAP